MKNLMLSFVLTFATTAVFAHEDTDVITHARATELGVHRIERLVNLKKIEANFISKMQTIELERLPHASLEEATFLVTFSQYPGIDGTKKQVQLFMNAQGKTLDNKIVSGSDAQNAPIWTAKDPATIMENALHFVLDNSALKPELKSFNDNLLKAELTQIIINGQNLALVKLEAKDTPRVLNILLKLDGSFLSYEIN